MDVYVQSSVAAAMVTVGALQGRLRPEHSALTATVLRLADAVDVDPASPGLWREYRAALADLYSVAEPVTEAASDDFAANVRTPVRNGARP